LKENEGVYAVVIGLLILSAFVIPYTLLSNVEKWYGSFLFWIVLTIVVIFANYLLIRDWGKEK
jgi:cyanate permease